MRKLFLYALLFSSYLSGMDRKDLPNAHDQRRDSRIHISFREALENQDLYTEHKNNLNNPPPSLRHHSISINSSEPDQQQHQEQEVFISRNNLKIAAFSFAASLVTAAVTVAITLSTQKSCE